jgi:hypothetical protein
MRLPNERSDGVIGNAGFSRIESGLDRTGESNGGVPIHLEMEDGVPPLS